MSLDVHLCAAMSTCLRGLLLASRLARRKPEEGRWPSEPLTHRIDVVVALAHAVVDPSEVPVALLRCLEGPRARGRGHGRVSEVVCGEPVLQSRAPGDASEELLEPVDAHALAGIAGEEWIVGGHL